MGKELFTTADNYMPALNEAHAPKDAMLLLAAALAVDTICNEQ